MEEEEYYKFIKRFFSRLAPVYDVVELFLSKTRKTVVELSGARNSSKILDLATGTGSQAIAFAKSGCKVIGFDLNKKMLERAIRKSKYSNLILLIADAVKIPFDDEYFDVSCISFALHDMPPAIRTGAIAEMRRITKRDGIMMIIDYGLPRNRFFKWIVYRVLRIYESKYYPGFIKSDFEGLLKDSGIEILHKKTIILGIGQFLKCKKH